MGETSRERWGGWIGWVRQSTRYVAGVGAKVEDRREIAFYILGNIVSWVN